MNPTRAALPAALLLAGCNALLGIDEPKTVSSDAPPGVIDAKPATLVDAPRPPDAPLVIVDAAVDAPRADAPLAIDARPPVDGAVDAAAVDASPPDAP